MFVLRISPPQNFGKAYYASDYLQHFVGGEWGFVSTTELASRVNGMCTKIKWETIEAVMGRDGRVGMPRL